MDLTEARYLADGIVARLKPTCEKITVCGSIRRQCKEIKDIDICLIPKRDKTKDLFGEVIDEPVIPEFANIVNSWTKVIGEPIGKYTRRLIEGGHHLELSICSPSTFWNLVLIRTGNAEFTHLMMSRARKLGYQQVDGVLLNGHGKQVHLTCEEDYFKALDVPYIVPQERDEDSFRRLVK